MAGIDPTDKTTQAAGSKEIVRVSHSSKNGENILTKSIFSVVNGKEKLVSEEIYHDFNYDGKVDWMEKTQYDESGRLVMKTLDQNMDGITDAYDKFEYDGQGRLSRHTYDEYDKNVIGSGDRVHNKVVKTFEYQGNDVIVYYDENGKKYHTKTLKDNDGNDVLYQEDYDNDGIYENTYIPGVYERPNYSQELPSENTKAVSESEPQEKTLD